MTQLNYLRIAVSELPKYIDESLEVNEDKPRQLDCDRSFGWTRETAVDYRRVEKAIESIGAKGKGWELYAWCDIGGYKYWVKQQREENYIQISIDFDADKVDVKEISKIKAAFATACAYACELSGEFNDLHLREV